MYDLNWWGGKRFAKKIFLSSFIFLFTTSKNIFGFTQHGKNKLILHFFFIICFHRWKQTFFFSTSYQTPERKRFTSDLENGSGMDLFSGDPLSKSDLKHFVYYVHDLTTCGGKTSCQETLYKFLNLFPLNFQVFFCNTGPT